MYSNGALDIKYDEREGFSTVVLNQIDKDEVPLKVPCKYVASSFDYFAYKEDLLSILRELPEVKIGDLHSMTLMALRFLVIDILKTENPLNYISEEDQ